MRTIIALALTFAASGALADELADAHKLALQGRDSYWNCLAREYQNEGAKKMSALDFTADIASVCPSERQNFRVTLMDYLSMQFPDAEFEREPHDGQSRHRACAKGHSHGFRPSQRHELAPPAWMPQLSPIPAARASVIFIRQGASLRIDRYDVGLGGGYPGLDRCGGRAGHGRDLWADRTVRKAIQGACCGNGSSGRAGRSRRAQGTGHPRSPELAGIIPLRNASAVPISGVEAMSMLQSSVVGTTTQ